jgi:ribonuclease P protein component
MLRSAADFRQVQSQSRSRSHPLLLLRYRRNDLERTRYGISTGRKLGSAVVRNAVRRRLRSVLREIDPVMPRGWDLLLVARPDSATAHQRDLDAALRHLLRGARLLNGARGVDQS